MRKSELGRTWDRKKRLRNTRERTPEEWEFYEQSKQTVWDRCRGVCEFLGCRELPDSRGPHHVLPQTKGGSDEPANLRALCPDHHAWVHNHKVEAVELGLYRRGGAQ